MNCKQFKLKIKQNLIFHLRSPKLQMKKKNRKRNENSLTLPFLVGFV